MFAASLTETQQFSPTFLLELSIDVVSSQPRVSQTMLRATSAWPLTVLGHSKSDLERGEGKEGRRRGKTTKKGEKKQEVFRRVSGVKTPTIWFCVELGGTSPSHLRLPSLEGMGAFPMRSRQVPAL